MFLSRTSFWASPLLRCLNQFYFKYIALENLRVLSGKKIYPKRFLTWSLCRNATIPTRIRPIMKLPIDEKYSSDQSQIARQINTTANSARIYVYAHPALLFWFRSCFGSLDYTTLVTLSLNIAISNSSLILLAWSISKSLYMWEIQ